MPTHIQLSAASIRAAKITGYRLHNILRTHPDQETVPLRDPDGDEDLTVPRQAAELLQRILAAIAAGTPVTVVPDHAEVTTQQAAEYLNASRPFLIKLLEQGEIECRLVGTHRRVRADSLRAYRDQSRAKQREAANECAKPAGRRLGSAPTSHSRPSTTPACSTLRSLRIALGESHRSAVSEPGFRCG